MHLRGISIKRIGLAVLLVIIAAGLGVSWFFWSPIDDQVEMTTAANDQVWTCSMHPQVRLSKPGKCPICLMALVPASDGERRANEGSEPMLRLSEHARAMAGVETATVERRKLSREIRAVGKVQYNETGLATITTRVEGYVEHLFVDYTGIEVKAGDHLVEIYSPDLVVAQQELLIALDSQRNQSLIESSKLKLLRWGLVESQIEDLIRNKKVSERLTLFSPTKGTVVEKMVVQNSAVKPGDVLYRLANLESVWVYLDVYEYELPWVQYGQIVEITSEAYPGQSLMGRVWFISPTLNEETRTIKVLVNIKNDEQKLKPGIYVSAFIHAELLADGKPAPTGFEGQWTCPMHPLVIQAQGGECPICKMPLVQIPSTPSVALSLDSRLALAVPVGAVLDSGLRKLVYVERGRGEFAAVEVKLGPRADGFFPVFAGLKEGDRVAVRGNFLLDSQFQIRGLPSLFYEQGQAGVPTGHQHGGASGPEAGGMDQPGSEKLNSQPQEHRH